MFFVSSKHYESADEEFPSRSPARSNRRPARPSPEQRDGRLDRALSRVSGAPLRYGNALALLHDGPATYEDWLAAIGRAQRWVHIENYIFKDDSIGQRFAAALAERAAAGVPVRVLYDWFGSLDVSNAFWRRMRRAGVDVRAVNPLWDGAPLDIFQRDHRKLLAVDGDYASIGGVCIADAWLATSPVTGLPYRDTAVRVTGPAVADLEHAFADIWDSLGSPLPADELPDLDSIAPAGDVEARVIVQEPGRLRMLRTLQVVLAGVERRMWIADAYFLADAHPARGDYGRRARRRGCAHPAALDQRCAAGGAALALWLPAAAPVGRADLGIRRPDDARQDDRRRRLVGAGRLDQYELHRPADQLGARPDRRGSPLCRSHGVDV